jgi:hypothetical protein
LPLPVVYGRHDTRFEPTCSHVITAEASDTSSAANKATTRICLFVRAAITVSEKHLQEPALPGEMWLVRVRCVCLVWVERMRKLQGV